MKNRRSNFTPLYVVVLFLLLVIAFLPTIASTSWGSQKLLNWYGKSKGFEISARSLSLNWFGPQTVTGLVVKDPPKGLQLNSEELRCNRSLFALLFSKCNDVDITQAAILLQMPQIEPVRFDNIHLKMRWPQELVANGETASGRFDIKIEKYPYDLEAQAHFNQFPVYAIDRLLSMYLPKSEGLLLTLIGPTADLDLNLDTEGEKQQLVLTAKSENFSANLRTTYKNNHLTLEEPASFRFQITPKLLDLLGIQTLITAPIPAALELSDFQIPFERAAGALTLYALPLEDQNLANFIGNRLQANFSYQAPTLTLAANTPTLALKESTFKVGNQLVLQKPTSLQISSAFQNQFVQLPENFAVSIEELKFPHIAAKASAKFSQLLIGKIPVNNAQVSMDMKEGETVNLHLKSDTMTASIKALLGKSVVMDANCPKLEIEKVGILHDLSLRANYAIKEETLDAKFSARSVSSNTPGKVNIEIEKTGSQLSGEIEMEKFSSSFLDMLVPGYRLRAWLGPTVSATGKFDFNNNSGPLNLRLHSSNARFSLSGSLESGVLKLKEPFYAQLQLTPELAPLLLEEVNPLSVPTFSSENPLTIEIAEANTTIPLIPFNPSQLNVSKARLELGQIVCENVGNLHFTLGLLQQQVSGNQPLHLWFAPADLTISNGVVSLERTEILIDKRLEICTWGEVNIPADAVRMVIGLPGPTLKKVFGLKDLPANYVLQLPMRGRLNNVQIDTSKATGKITALLLWQKASTAGAIGGGLPGAIVGELFGKVVPLPDGDKKAPSAKRPFPWEQEKLRSEKPKTEKGIKFKKEDDDPLSLLKFLGG